MLAINTHIYATFLDLFSSIKFRCTRARSMLFAQSNLFGFTSRFNNEVNDKYCESGERYERDDVSCAHPMTPLVKRRVQKHLVRIMNVALHFGALLCSHINFAGQKRTFLAPFVDGNANASDQKNSEYPNNKFHTFQHMVERSDFQGAAPCYS